MNGNHFELIEKLLIILNTNINSLENKPISSTAGLLVTFSELVMMYQKDTGVKLYGDDIKDEIADIIKENNPTKAFEYLESVVKVFVQTMKQVLTEAKGFSINFSGEVNVSVRGYDKNTSSRITQSFTYVYKPKTKPRSTKELAKIILINIIAGCRLEPDRIGKCQWGKCGNYFYKYQSKKKLFCSSYCTKSSSKAKKATQGTKKK